MKKTALLLMIITLASKIFGFFRDLTLSYFYGASNISDVYIISTTIPLAIFSFIATGISTGYIPMYSRIEQTDGIEKANIFTHNVLNILMALSTCIVILGLLFTEDIVKIFAAGFEGETLALAIKFTKICLLGIYFTGLIAVFTGFLQLKGNYSVPALVVLPMNLIIIISIVLGSQINTVILAVGTVVATAVQLLLMLPFIFRKGYKYKFIFDIKDKHVKTMAYIAFPVIIGASVNQINNLIDRTIASNIIVGGISALNYASKLNGFVVGIFVLSISTAMYPMISKMAAEKDIEGLKKAVAEAISGTNLLIIPATIGAMVFAKPIVKLLFGRGVFDVQAISMTSSALFYYSIGTIGYGLREVLSRAFFSLQDSRTPMINAIIAMLMNIILNIILSKFMGISGLALATSIAAIFTVCLLFISLRRKIGSFGIKQISISSVKIIFASLIMGVIAKASFNYLISTSISQNVSLIMSIGIGGITYLTIIYFMKIDYVDIIASQIKEKLKTI